MSSTGPRRDAIGRRGTHPASRSGHRAGRGTDGDRAEPDPVRPVSLARPRTDPRRGAGRTHRHRVDRGPGRRAPRRRRGHAPRLAAAGRLRSSARARPAPVMGPLGHIGRGTGPDPGGARPGPGRHERTGRLQPADRRIRPDDDPRRQPAAAAAPRTAARADLAATRGRGAPGRDRRHRRARVDGPGGGRPGDRLRLPGHRRSTAARGGDRADGLGDRPGGSRRSGTRGDPARPDRWAGQAAGAARRVGLHRPGGAPDPRDRGHDQRRDARDGQAGRLAHQRGARPAGRRAGVAASAARRPARWGRARHVPRRAAAADVLVLRPAQRHRHAAHRVVQRARPRPERRALLRQPAPIRGRRAAAQRRRSGGRLLSIGRRAG